jgi:hypothetical protein
MGKNIEVKLNLISDLKHELNKKTELFETETTFIAMEI